MRLKKITQDDLVPRVYPWTKISKYAISENGILIKFDGALSDGFPVYLCLYEGWWEVSDVCPVGIRGIMGAEPVSLKIAEAIMRKEEKPIEERPHERNSWLTC